MALRAFMAATFLAVAAMPALAADGDPMVLRGAFGEDPAATGDPATTGDAPLAADAATPAPAVDPLATGSLPDGSSPAGKTSSRVSRVNAEPAVDSSDPAAGIVSGAAVRRVTDEEDPYAPVGIRVGSFIYYPAVTVGAGFTTNAENIAGGHASPSLDISPELLIQSDWARHEATFSFKGDWEHFTDGSARDNPSAEVAATGRLDIADRWSLDFDSTYAYSQQSVSDPNFPTGATDNPGVHTIDTGAALNGAVGRNEFTFGTRAIRSIYEDADTGSSTIDQSYRDNWLYSERLRFGYELSPAFTPFVEGELFQRVYDADTDDSGIARSSRGFAVRAGLAFEDAPIWKGEIAIGTRQEKLDDPSLATLRALTVDGSLVWSPTALTTVTTDLSTGFNPSTNPDSPGSIVYDASIDFAYAWRPNVTFDLTGSAEYERFVSLGETDWTYDLGASATWKLNRSMQLKAGYVHEWVTSNVPGVAYASDAVRVDLRLQH
jgi:hypothetical protein